MNSKNKIGFVVYVCPILCGLEAWLVYVGEGLALAIKGCMYWGDSSV